MKKNAKNEKLSNSKHFALAEVKVLNNYTGYNRLWNILNINQSRSNLNKEIT